MESKIRKPGWWLLFVLLIGMLGLILLESQDGVPNSVHEIIDGVIVIGFFGALMGWLHINRSALEQIEIEHASLGEFYFVEYEPQRPPVSKTPPEILFLADSGDISTARKRNV